MATIIDYSPTALEIDEVAEAAGTINVDVAPPIAYTASPVVNPAATPSMAKLFTGAGPDILFASEYAVPGKASSGVLVVWEDFYNATHYEVFRRSILSTDTTWQRILVCDVNHLATETNFFTPYITNVLKLSINSKYFAILDTDVASDQIVEYKVTACYYPTSANIDYSTCLKSQNLVNSVAVAAGETLFDFSQRVLGTQDYAWVVALINDGVHYFGQDAATQPLSSFVGSSVLMPYSLDTIPKMIQESVHFFSLTSTFRNMLNKVKDTVLTTFYDDIFFSISETDQQFHYLTAQAKLAADYPNYKNLADRGLAQMSLLFKRAAAAAAAVMLGFEPISADAHVKWFCAFSVAGQPEGLSNVLCQDFELLCVIAIAALVFGALVDRSVIGAALNRALDRVFTLIAIQPDVVVRAGVAFMMIGAFTLGGVLLTPELTTTSPFVPWLQLLIALCLVHRRTLPVAALGLASLFVMALATYGAFHLADYPVFLGVAAYLTAIGLERTIFGKRPLDVLRWSIACTLMWASIEKWAYPGWTYPLFIQHPGMAMGFDPAFYMRAAGTVEFALAFALLMTPFSRRCAAIMLAAIFVSAIPAFGVIDAIGHAGVIGVLFSLMLDDAKRLPKLREVALLPFGFAASLASFLCAYYVGHAALFGTTIL